MTKPAKEFSFTYDTLAQLSGWKYNTVTMAVKRGELDPEDLAGVAVWLAANGRPRLRASMASHLLPVALGTRGRDQKRNVELDNVSGSFDLLTEIFERDDRPRRSAAKNKSKAKQGIYNAPKRTRA
jgi:hypothetical protein